MITAQRDQIERMFAQEITETEFVVCMRKFMSAVVLQHLESDSLMYSPDIRNGYYWLNELVEILDTE